MSAQTEADRWQQESVCMGHWSGILREDIGVGRFEDHDGFLANLKVLHAKRMADIESGTISAEEALQLENLNSEAFRSARAAVLGLDDPERADQMRALLTQSLAACAPLVVLGASPE